MEVEKLANAANRVNGMRNLPRQWRSSGKGGPSSTAKEEECNLKQLQFHYELKKFNSLIFNTMASPIHAHASAALLLIELKNWHSDNHMVVDTAPK